MFCLDPYSMFRPMSSPFYGEERWEGGVEEKEGRGGGAVLQTL